MNETPADFANKEDNVRTTNCEVQDMFHADNEDKNLAYTTIEKEKKSFCNEDTNTKNVDVIYVAHDSPDVGSAAPKLEILPKTFKKRSSLSTLTPEKTLHDSYGLTIYDHSKCGDVGTEKAGFVDLLQNVEFRPVARVHSGKKKTQHVIDMNISY